MFDRLTERLGEALRNLRGRGVVNEADLKNAMREVRRALLEADVSFRVAKGFVASVREKALGEKVLGSMTPGQQIVGIVRDELAALLGSGRSELDLGGTPPVTVLLMGLQGSGKTTTAARLAVWLSERRGKRCLLAACDLQRPAAVDQLEKVAEAAGAGFYGRRDTKDPVAVLREAREEARLRSYDVVIADTAGRLHVDEELMDELSRVSGAADASETLLVLDGLSGQDVVNVAEAFGERIGYTGAVITKMDGDSRGGAALSFRESTGVPIKYVGVGESVDGLEQMDPERMAGRILGMGDVLSLVEKARSAYEENEAEELERKIVSASFTLEDFAKELKRLKRMGSLGDILGMLPKNMRPSGADLDTDRLHRMEAMIQSMTPRERRHPEMINGSRRKRIARGSGVRVNDVNRLLKEFRTMRSMMKRMKSAGRSGLAGMLR